MQKIVSNGFRALSLALCLQLDVAANAADEPQGAPIPATPPFASPDIKPTFADWLTARPVALGGKVLTTDPLQKPPFVGQPPDSLKGMAAGIRAVQLDVPNRVKAAAYLGTVDCVTYPQAQAMLIATMQEDPSEAVRYEAVMALRMMLSRGCGNMETGCECQKCGQRKKIARESERHSNKMQKAIVKEAKCHAKIAALKAKRTVKTERYDCCRGCSNPKVLKALAEVAYGKDDQCCFIEPSERVREAAAEGLSLGCVPTEMTGDMYYSPEAVQPTEDGGPVPKGSSEVSPPEDMESAPGAADEAPEEKKPAPTPLPTSSKSNKVIVRPQMTQVVVEESATVPTPAINPSIPDRNRKYEETVATLPALSETPQETTSVLKQSKPVSAAPSEAPVLAALNGHCIVALKNRQFIKASQEFSSVFKGHTYYFSSDDAKWSFDLEPERYAPAYGGVDPVEWLASKTAVEGKFLREFDDRFYLFTDKEHWELFKATPDRFILASSRPTVAKK